MKTICVILTGGSSRRMGQDKAQLRLQGETFLARLIRTYRAAFPVYVSVRNAGARERCGAEELVDLSPGMGPLAGLEAAFAQTDADIVFLTATDIPFGTLALANRLLAELEQADACVIRRCNGNVEPAFGVYRRSCQAALQHCLAAGNRAVRQLLEQVRVRYVPEESLREFPLEQLLQNVNTPEDYRRIYDGMT